MIKPASPTPWSILKLMETIEDVLPPGVINVVTGPGAEIGKALAANPRIAKVSFTGETVTGRLIMQYAAQDLIPSTVELGGKSPNIFFNDVMAHDDEFMARCLERIAGIRQGNPLDTDTQLGPQVSAQQIEKSHPTSTSAATRAPRCSSAASAPAWTGRNSPTAITSSRRC